MKIKWSRLWARIRKISLPDWRVLLLLVIGAFLQGISFVYLDVGTSALFLQNHGIFYVGIDFLFMAPLLPFIGSLTVKLDRRNGYGGAPLTALLTLILVGILALINTFGVQSVFIQALFVYKYVAMILFSTIFWTIAHRFILLRFNSFKFLGVMGAELLGLFIGGAVLAHPNSHALAHLNGAVGWLTGLFLILKILVWLLPMSTETFVRKSGGVQDASENKMVGCILCLSFLYAASSYLSDYFLLHTLVIERADFGQVIAHLWLWRGVIGLLLVALCFRVAYTYIQITSLWGILMGLLVIFMGTLGQKPLWVYVGIVMTSILGHFCWQTYLSTLPQLLSLGQGRRLRWQRQVIVQPLAVLFSGSLIITVPMFYQPFILLLMTFMLGCFMNISLSFYARFLLHMCQMRRWCTGPVMLISQKVVYYVLKGVQSPLIDDAIYFLRLMQQADFPKYTKCLIQALNHKETQVRLFALDKLDMMGVTTSLARLLNQKMQKEKSEEVRCRMLAMLIRYHGEQNARTLFHRYGAYLDDKKLQAGAVLGFLQSGGDSALLAMDGLQQMAQSPDKKQNMKALDIIDHMPQTGLVRLVLPLLKTEDDDLMRLALLTAGRIGHVQALSFVLSALDRPEYQEVALEALKKYGKQAFPPIEKMLTNPYVPMERRKKLVLFLQNLPSVEGKQILLRNINMPEQKLRKDILRAILNSKIIWVSWRRRKILKQALFRDINRWHWLQNNIQKCRQAPDSRLSDAFSFLLRSFEDSCNDTRLIILYQLMLLYPDSLIERAVEILLVSSGQHYDAAFSLLKDLLPRKLCQKLEPVLMNHEHTQQQSLNLTQAMGFLIQLAVQPDFEVDRWVQSCAILGLKQIGNLDQLIVLKKAFCGPWPIVWEAALDNLNSWVKDEKERKNILKNLMMENPNLAFNSYLKQQEQI